MQTNLTARIEAATGALSEPEKCALLSLSHIWTEGPSLPETVTDHLKALCAGGLVSRAFGDRIGAVVNMTSDGLTMRTSACWYFSLTDFGLDCAAALKARNNGGE